MPKLGWHVKRYNGWELEQEDNGPLCKVADVSEVLMYNKLADSHLKLMTAVEQLLKCCAGTIGAEEVLESVLTSQRTLDEAKRENPNGKR